MAELLYIQATTLQEIIDAIEASGYVTVRIQVSPSNADGYIIAKKLLKKIADEVRAFDGTIAEILIKELAKRILCKKVIKLATPVVALYDENGIISPSYDTTAILGKAILGYAILGNSGGNVQKLATPVIYLYDDASDEPALPAIKLNTPVVYLYNDSEDPDIPDQPTIIKLATPIIELIIEEESDDPVTKIVKLETPVIYLEKIDDDLPEEPDVPDQPTTVKLATPVIELVIEDNESETPEEPDKPTILKLDTPVIKLVEDVVGDDSGDDSGDNGGGNPGSGGVTPPTPGGDVTEDQM